MRIRILAVVGLVLALPSLASAQRWGRERYPQSGACFYRHPYFQGDYFCIRAGDQAARLSDEANDEISSILVFGRAEVFVYRDWRFAGPAERFDYSIENLEDYPPWDDQISSMRVEERGRPGRFGDLNDENRGRDRGNDRRDDRRDNRRRPEDADRIVRRAYQDVLGRDPDEAGLRQYRSRIIDDDWSEEQVRNSIRNSPEFAQVRRNRAQEIVRAAYRAVLNRDPDPGAETYVQNVLRDNWSQQDVERALRNSPEFRNRR